MSVTYTLEYPQYTVNTTYNISTWKFTFKTQNKFLYHDNLRLTVCKKTSTAIDCFILEQVFKYIFFANKLLFYILSQTFD